MAKPNLRPDHNGTQRAQFNSNKKKIYATQKVCGICGKPVDFRIKFPDPLSPHRPHHSRVKGRTPLRHQQYAAGTHDLQPAEVRQARSRSGLRQSRGGHLQSCATADL